MKEIKFEYGFLSVNGIIKKTYHLSEIPDIKNKCDVWNILPIVYVREWTGLKDKNGKDIYEGDIIKITHPYKSREFKGEVIWMNYQYGCKDFWFSHFDNPGDIFSEGTEYIEICGSIHDNKVDS